MRTIFYKELASVIMKTGRPQDLQGESPSWRPRGGDSVVPVQRPAGLRPRKSLSLRLKAGKILSYSGEAPLFCSI